MWSVVLVANRYRVRLTNKKVTGSIPGTKTKCLLFMISKFVPKSAPSVEAKEKKKCTINFIIIKIPRPYIFCTSKILNLSVILIHLSIGSSIQNQEFNTHRWSIKRTLIIDPSLKKIALTLYTSLVYITIEFNKHKRISSSCFSTKQT